MRLPLHDAIKNLPFSIIGIDVATVSSKVGLAEAVYDCENKATLLNVKQCGNGPSPAQIVSDWIKGQERRILLAMDAPLGWPTAMGKQLSKHCAGNPLYVCPNKLFRRETDRYIKNTIKKTPLDVGADRIARTAHAALVLLDDLRTQLGKDIPLAWSPDFNDIAAIEVYPAATLKVLGIRSSGYKAENQEGERSEILNSLSVWVKVGRYAPEVVKNPDVLDALVCVIAGMDFISGRAMPPPNRELAEREGWIWIRSPTQ